ncbi:MAG TPA: hypothetical protein PLI59_19610, partial [Candidatus Obscuribacter sp.]|nr:hypothetical protein [Candidatus Obscuribacter sp.]
VELIKPWKRLAFLLFHKGTLKETNLSLLDQLHHLDQLELVECETNKNVLANLNCLTKLRIFTMVNGTEPTPERDAPQIARILERLAQNKRLSILNLKGQPISHKTMRRVLMAPSMKTLIVFGYRWNEDNLKTLKTESNIQFLAVKEADIPEKLIPLLAGAKHLNGLAIEDVNSRQTAARLLALRPLMVNARGRKIDMEVTLKPGIDY